MENTQNKKFFGTINTTGTKVGVECEVVDEVTIKAGNTYFSGVIEDADMNGYVKMTDYATGEELVFNAAQAGIFGVDYYDSENPKSNTTLWRLSSRIAADDFQSIYDMMVRVHNMFPETFLEVGDLGEVTEVWLWADEKRSNLLRQLTVNFPVQVSNK